MCTGCRKNDSALQVSVHRVSQRWLNTTGISAQRVAKMIQHYTYQRTECRRWLNTKYISAESVEDDSTLQVCVQGVAKMTQNYRYQCTGCRKDDSTLKVSVHRVSQRWFNTTRISAQCVAKMIQHYTYQCTECRRWLNTMGMCIGCRKNDSALQVSVHRVSQTWLNTTGISVQSVAKMTQHYAYQCAECRRWLNITGMCIGCRKNDSALHVSVHRVLQRLFNTTAISVQNVAKMTQHYTYQCTECRR